jgi:hypothetical protein
MPTAVPHESAETIQHLFDEIANSEIFRGAPVMRTLLIYLWEHRGESINEYAIGVDGLGRPPEFDPKADATVRVQVARLRAKLKEFYEKEKDTFALRLTVPLGRHELEWSHDLPAVPAQPVNIPERPVRSFRGLSIALGLAALVLAILAAVLLRENRTLKAAIPRAVPQLPRFWKSFLGTSQHTSVVLPSPVYFRWPAQRIVIRDFNVSEFQSWSSSPVIRDLAKTLGPPSLYQIYVSGLDLEAGVRVMEYLKKFNEPVELIESRSLSADSLIVGNVIYLGIPRTVEYLKQVLEKTNFYMDTATPSIVRSRHPAPGEPAEYREVDFSDEHKIYPGLIAQLPPTPDGNRALILMGPYPMAFTSMLLSQTGLQQMDNQWRKAGSPESWEMVVQTELNGETILKAWSTSMRAIPANFWK